MRRAKNVSVKGKRLHEVIPHVNKARSLDYHLRTGKPRLRPRRASRASFTSRTSFTSCFNSQSAAGAGDAGQRRLSDVGEVLEDGTYHTPWLRRPIEEQELDEEAAIVRTQKYFDERQLHHKTALDAVTSVKAMADMRAEVIQVARNVAIRNRREYKLRVSVLSKRTRRVLRRLKRIFLTGMATFAIGWVFWLPVAIADGFVAAGEAAGGAIGNTLHGISDGIEPAVLRGANYSMAVSLGVLSLAAGGYNQTYSRGWVIQSSYDPRWRPPPPSPPPPFPPDKKLKPPPPSPSPPGFLHPPPSPSPPPPKPRPPPWSP